jgi:hypothetical protein
VFFEVGRRSNAINHGKKARPIQRRQYAVPGAPVQVDALCAVGQECAGSGFGVGSNDNKERMLGHRNEGLRALGVTFYQIEDVGQAAGLGLKDGNTSLCIVKIEFGAVMEAAAEALVYDFFGGAGCVKHIAKGGEGCGGQGFDLDGSSHSDLWFLGWPPGDFTSPGPPVGYFYRKESISADSGGRANWRGG